MDSMVPQDGSPQGIQTAAGSSATPHPCLIADDLTGALDTAAQFAAVTGPIPVYWQSLPYPTLPTELAFDSGTREATRDEARRRVASIAAGLPRSPGSLHYAKLDSLLRGHAGAEIAAWIAATAPDHVIVAPAFPYQGRITRGGIQLARGDDARSWTPVASDLRADLEQEGFAVQPCCPGAAVPAGVSLWDAETDADLDAVAAAGLALNERVLWCGSSGLAGALARQLGAAVADTDTLRLPLPILGLFGTNHPAMTAQIDACPEHVLALPDGGSTSATVLAQRLDRDDIALATLALPGGLARSDAAQRIEREFARLVRRLDPPGTLLVAGGETLRGLCLALDADRLDLDGHVWPGVPCSILRGGRFDGVRVISKSGAFGDPSLLRRLLALAAPLHQGEQA
ncbi:four-carbon acid sugar kinase family protein [Azospirillum sp. TSH64]|uniref:four-carbon acid sugar kinase family protein n=1 Tax=Azospirillum sp. TSH64 TaxID=652740 RepID=UPI001FFFE7CB|nr:four-carbon acid sugar kinase family protein [Azospirillum sp. TSH64]